MTASIHDLETHRSKLIERHESERAKRKLLAREAIGEVMDGAIRIRFSRLCEGIVLTPAAAETFARGLLELVKSARAEGSER